MGFGVGLRLRVFGLWGRAFGVFGFGAERWLNAIVCRHAGPRTAQALLTASPGPTLGPKSELKLDENSPKMFE